ncbi:DUF1674 domain-containing protein [Lysobacter sp. A286]
MIGQTTSETDSEASPGTPAPRTPETTATPLVPVEHGGRSGPDPTRYGDWEKNGRCIDF